MSYLQQTPQQRYKLEALLASPNRLYQYQMSGIQKIEKTVTSNDNAITLSSLMDGTYLVKIQDETATKFMKILVRK
jgi:hypothetical protein